MYKKANSCLKYTVFLNIGLIVHTNIRRFSRRFFFDFFYEFFSFIYFLFHMNLFLHIPDEGEGLIVDPIFHQAALNRCDLVSAVIAYPKHEIDSPYLYTMLLTQTKTVKTTIGHRAERNGQSYARRMPYGGARYVSS
jgi:hypothetical protein